MQEPLCSLNGSGRRKRSSIRLKMEVFRPIPSARVMTAITVNPGDLRSCRNAKRSSFIIAVSLKVFSSFCAQRYNRIDTRRAASRYAAGNQSDKHQRRHRDDDSATIESTHIVKQRHQRAASSNRTDQANSNADRDQRHALAEHELENVCALCAQG